MKRESSLHIVISWWFLVIAAVLSIVLTRLVNQDIEVSRLFFNPDGGYWPLANHPVVEFLYLAGSVIGVVILLLSLVYILASLVIPRLRSGRGLAIFLLALYLFGPGVLVNAVFKEHWGRPRPTQVQDFGGTEAFVPLGQYNPHGIGKSFPSGHSSVGFALVGLWVWWYKRRPRLAWASLAFGVLSGTAVGFARIVEGAHFLSDVIWSSLICLFTALVLYHWLRDKRVAPDGELTLREKSLIGAAVVVIVASLFVIPVKRDHREIIPLADGAQDLVIDRLCLALDDTDLILRAAPEPPPDQRDAPAFARFTLLARGFGFVDRRLLWETSFEGRDYRMVLRKLGTYSEYHSRATLTLFPGDMPQPLRLQWLEQGGEVILADDLSDKVELQRYEASAGFCGDEVSVDDAG
jgi:membrane-associated PAP2 superfamily phosphatase